ncbi:MAG: glycosyltransferase [Chlorobiaceae bacterium]|nr:glycosyltransferase [Chlorobiaceae bacterium]
MAIPPKVSVVVKSYNHAPYVRQTIQSILDQSFQDFEIVVTDDHSSDGTADVVREFQDKRIRLEVSSRNNGISITMNSVIARATGEYIAIVNSDDFALPGRLETQVSFMEKRADVAALFGLPLPVDEQGNPTASFNDFDRPLSFPDFDRSTWLNSFFFRGNCLCAPTAMVRRDVYDKVGKYDPRLTNLQDLDMWVRMLKAGYDIYLLPEQFTAFRIRDGNKNMSAPRPDSILRHHFELVQILRHYIGMDPQLISDIFAAEMVGAGIEDPVGTDMLLVEMGLSVGSSAYNLFALQLLFDIAETVDDFTRLSAIAGKLDIFGILDSIVAEKSHGFFSRLKFHR